MSAFTFLASWIVYLGMQSQIVQIVQIDDLGFQAMRTIAILQPGMVGIWKRWLSFDLQQSAPTLIQAMRYGQCQ
jgi:hypothetical protein